MQNPKHSRTSKKDAESEDEDEDELPERLSLEDAWLFPIVVSAQSVHEDHLLTWC